jgi:hypothetical protein
MARFQRQFAVFRAMFIELPANAGFHGLREPENPFGRRSLFSFQAGNLPLGLEFQISPEAGHGFQRRLEHGCQETLAKAGFQR